MNNWIAFVSETYIFLGVCAAINYYYLRFDTPGNILNSLLTCFFTIVLFAFPFFVAIFYSRTRNLNLILSEDKLFNDKYGHAIEGLNLIRQGRSVLFFPFFNYLRSLALICTVVFWQSQPILSIFVVNHSSLMVIAVTGLVNPFKDPLRNRMQLLNEMFVLVLTYH